MHRRREEDVRRESLVELSGTEVSPDEVRRRAGAFFLGWLILAASMSLAGNVGHALLIAPAETRWLAAAASLVPPIVLLAATHSASWLVRAKSSGWVFWVALILNAGVVLGSFALSFNALRSLAVMVGIRESMSWIWPAVIDIAIAHATVCLLSLTRIKRGRPMETRTRAGALLASQYSEVRPVRSEQSDRQSREELSSHPLMPPTPAQEGPVACAPGPIEDGVGEGDESNNGVNINSTANLLLGTDASPSLGTGTTGRSLERALSAVAGATVPPRVLPPAEGDADVDRWQPVAESLVRDGITTKDPDLIAKILADNAAGTPPSTIGRRHEVHYTTVNRILSAVEQLSEASAATG
jgi:hypothetical protein